MSGGLPPQEGDTEVAPHWAARAVDGLTAFTRWMRVIFLLVLPVILGLLAYRVENYPQGTFMLALGLGLFWWTGRLQAAT